MRSVLSIVCATCATFVTSRNVQLDETISKFNGSARLNSRYSNSIQEDTRLNVVSSKVNKSSNFQPPHPYNLLTYYFYIRLIYREHWWAVKMWVTWNASSPSFYKFSSPSSQNLLQNTDIQLKYTMSLLRMVTSWSSIVYLMDVIEIMYRTKINQYWFYNTVCCARPLCGSLLVQVLVLVSYIHEFITN